MNTVARTVEKDNIHLYFHLIYVNSPDSNAKKEYQRRVSPIVLRGGLPRLVHRPQIKTLIDITAKKVSSSAHSLALRALAPDSK